MIKEIKFGGMTTVPSDYECQDGDLTEARNIILNNGIIQPAKIPHEIKSSLAGYTPLCIFTPADEGILYYIMLNTSGDIVSLKDVAAATPVTFATSTQVGNVRQVTHIGNIITIASNTGIHYARWNNHAFHYIGSNPPKLNIWASCNNNDVEKRQEEVAFPNAIYPNWNTDPDFQNHELIFDTDYVSSEYREVIGENRTKIAGCVFSMTNQLEAAYRNQGKIYYPRYLRAAYRLYDGSYVSHTPPMLLVPNSIAEPIAFYQQKTGPNDAYIKVHFHYADIVISLCEKIPVEWQDIIVGVDFFLSDNITAFSNADISFVKLSKQNPGINESPYGAEIFADYEKYELSLGRVIQGYYRNILFSRADRKELADVIDATATFHLVCQMKAEEYNSLINISQDDEDGRTDWIKLPLDIARYTTLTTQPTLPDTGQMHNRLIPQSIYAYNNRLNVSLEAIQITAPAYIDSYNLAEDPLAAIQFYIHRVMVEIKSAAKTLYLSIALTTPRSGGTPGQLEYKDQFRYLFIHHNNATRILLKTKSGNDDFVIKQINLHPHALLNGAYAFNSFNPLSIVDSDISAQDFDTLYTSNDANIDYGNTILTSEVNNPFLLPELYNTNVGTARILGMAATTVPLSAGQHGQHPLYVFATDGIYALSIAQDGTINRTDSVSRDICINPKSITPIDNAVLYVTAQGVMLLQGQQSVCISDSIKKDAILAKTIPSVGNYIVANNLDNVQILPFLSNARMIYNNAEQTVTLYNPTKDNVTHEYVYNYAYVFSLRDKTWQRTEEQFTDHFYITSEALAINSQGKLVSLSKAQNPFSGGMIITRPMKLGMPDILKTVTTLIVRGHFRKGHIKTVLYASRDLFNWHIVQTSQDHTLRGFRGTPYKYFRVALICNLSADESLTGCTIELTPRYTNKLR